MGHGWCHIAARRGGRGASVAVGRCGVAGGGPAMMLARAVRLAPKLGRATLTSGS
jgi:hypothetical protein